MNPWLQRKTYRCPECNAVYLHDQAHKHAAYECPNRASAKPRATGERQENSLMRSLSSVLLVLAFLIPSGVQAEPNPYTTQATMQSAAASNANGSPLNTNIDGYGFQLVTFVVSGTFSATINPEGTQDGTNWQALFCMPISGGAGTTTFTAAGGWRCNLGGSFIQVRARISGYASGSITVTGMASFAGTVSNRSTHE